MFVRQIVVITTVHLVWFWLYFGVIYPATFDMRVENGTFPILRQRIGTILWHSFDGTKVEDTAWHTYCLWPDPITAQRDQVYILKRKDQSDCAGFKQKVWLGEGYWVSEREKIWVSREEYLAEVGKLR